MSDERGNDLRVERPRISLRTHSEIITGRFRLGFSRVNRRPIRIDDSNRVMCLEQNLVPKLYLAVQPPPVSNRSLTSVP